MTAYSATRAAELVAMLRAEHPCAAGVYSLASQMAAQLEAAVSEIARLEPMSRDLWALSAFREASEAVARDVEVIRLRAELEVARARLARVEQASQRLADAAQHCKGCVECGDGPCCDHCDVDAAIAAISAARKTGGGE
jgi:hypothetical protein